MSDADTATVIIEVVEVDRLARGPIMAVACVRLDLDGVELVLQGVTMRRDGAGRADIMPPQFRCPRTGRWFPGVVLPDELWGAIALEVMEAVTGQRGRLVEAEEPFADAFNQSRGRHDRST